MNLIVLAEEETKTIKYINNCKQNSSKYLYIKLEKMNIRKVLPKNFMKKYYPQKMPPQKLHNIRQIE
jgi:hypothetical protein